MLNFQMVIATEQCYVSMGKDSTISAYTPIFIRKIGSSVEYNCAFVGANSNIQFVQRFSSF